MPRRGTKCDTAQDFGNLCQVPDEEEFLVCEEETADIPVKGEKQGTVYHWCPGKYFEGVKGDVSEEELGFGKTNTQSSRSKKRENKRKIEKAPKEVLDITSVFEIPMKGKKTFIQEEEQKIFSKRTGVKKDLKKKKDISAPSQEELMARLEAARACQKKQKAKKGRRTTKINLESPAFPEVDVCPPSVHICNAEKEHANWVTDEYSYDESVAQYWTEVLDANERLNEEPVAQHWTEDSKTDVVPDKLNSSEYKDSKLNWPINHIMKIILTMLGVLMVSSILFLVFFAFPAYQDDVHRIQEMARQATEAHEEFYYIRLEVNRFITSYFDGYLDFAHLQVPELVIPDCEPSYGFLFHFMS